MWKSQVLANAWWDLLFIIGHSDEASWCHGMIVVSVSPMINAVKRLDIFSFHMFSFVIFEASFQTSALSLAERKCPLTFLS